MNLALSAFYLGVDLLVKRYFNNYMNYISSLKLVNWFVQTFGYSLVLPYKLFEP